jgi:hypothetical protein
LVTLRSHADDKAPETDKLSSRAETTIDIHALPYTRDSGWNELHACLLNTRTSIIDEVLAWIRRPDISGSQQVYFLADVAGSGKTALAHAIAWRCSDEGLLVSSFFFDRKAGRTSPRDFVSSLARDLCSRSKEVAERVSLALKAQPSLAQSLSLVQCFRKLVLEPVTHCHIDGPIVVVIDALDEGDSAGLIKILRHDVPKLPGNFRIFLTSRPERTILQGLSPDIRPHTIDIHGTANLDDIALYIDHRMKEIALEHELENWPNPDVSEKLKEKAEGLFIWVATVCEYLLRQVSHPDKTLEELLNSMRESQLPPEKKMDSLYSTILSKCHWDDSHFVAGYQDVMGVIVAAEIPLSVDAIQKIHGDNLKLRVKAILSPLASLVTGLTRVDDRVRMLHDSFREFITRRAEVPKHVHAKKNSARLATLCLQTLNETFATTISGTGYLSEHADSPFGIPYLEVDHITEEQWYAARFWLAHIVKVAKPVDPQVVELLRTFLSRHLTTWIEVLISRWPYESLTPIRRWLEVSTSVLPAPTLITLTRVYGSQKNLPENQELSRIISNKKLAQLLCGLVICLGSEDRQREALDVLDELSDMKARVVYSESDDEDTDESMPGLQTTDPESELELSSEPEWPWEVGRSP